MMTCRLLCALLVLALCCCPSVCVAVSEINDDPSAVPAVSKVPEVQEAVEKEVEQSEKVEKPVIAAGMENTQGMVSGGSSNSQGASGVSGHSTLQTPGVPLRPPTVPTVASGEQSGLIVPEKKKRRRRLHQRPRRPQPQRHQPPPRRKLQRRQLLRPPAHRHVFAKLTAASAALRGCVPRCCLPYPRWRTPLWAEEVYCGLCVPALNHGDMCASTVVRCK
ncbi:mucin TcMUCII [Trypanosoma cruzi]|nr:mucin TcMUCII [Trypanosoma cruzi]